jgi:translocation and assembly module TamA
MAPQENLPASNPARRLLAPFAVMALLWPVPHAGASDAPRLMIEGGTAEQHQNLRAFVPMTRYTCDLPVFRERGVIRDSVERARQALRALGHYQPVVEFSIAREAECWDLQLMLDPGPPVRIADIDVRVSGEGAEDPALVAVVSTPEIAVGDPLRHDAHDALRNRLVRVAGDRGYFQSRLQTSELRVDPALNEARVIIHLESGPRYRFGEITLEQDILDPGFVARLFPFERGDPYSTSQLLALQRNLRDSGYFEAVRVRPSPDEAVDGEVPIVAEVTARKRSAYEFRAGFSTDLGPRVGLVVERRYVNRLGHRYSAELEASQKRSGLGFSYTVPLEDPLRENLNLYASVVSEDIDGNESDRFQTGVSHVLWHESGWQTIRGIRYEYEDFTVGRVSDTTHLLIPSYALSRTRADDLLSPRNGYRVGLLAQGAAEPLASSTSFLQGKASAKWIRGMGTGRLILRGDAGLTSVGSVDELPSSLRFFAGGDTSVRGFGFQRLGPTDQEGRVIGGRHLLTGSVEYDRPIGGGPWGVAVFLDAGNAFNASDDYDPSFGAGVGVRWRSPVGPIRLDLAHAPDSRDSFRIHFTMGPDL